jgi:hypothetical protein
LEALDRHCFDKMDSTNSLDTLYSQIFPTPPVKENPVEGDSPIVLLLLRWAVGSQRTGEHRALAVARLLEHRQSDVLNSAHSDGDKENQNQQNGENGPSSVNIKVESPNEDAPMLDCEGENSNFNIKIVNGLSLTENEEGEFPNGLPIYHSLLLRFLDTEAPVIGKYLSFFKNWGLL